MAPRDRRPSADAALSLYAAEIANGYVYGGRRAHVLPVGARFSIIETRQDSGPSWHKIAEGTPSTPEQDSATYDQLDDGAATSPPMCCSVTQRAAPWCPEPKCG